MTNLPRGWPQQCPAAMQTLQRGRASHECPRSHTVYLIGSCGFIGSSTAAGTCGLCVLYLFHCAVAKNINAVAPAARFTREMRSSTMSGER